MPVLQNLRHERFALGLVEGLSQGDAYMRAGFNTRLKGNLLRSEASKLAKREDIKGRVIELQELQVQRLGVTVDSLIGELDEMRKLAIAVKNPAAGVGAVMGKAKLLGLIVDKAEVEGTLRKPAREPTDKKQMSVDEWTKKFAPKAVLQ